MRPDYVYELTYASEEVRTREFMASATLRRNFKY